MEMEMRASEEIRQGEDITPPLFPLTFAFHDSLLDGHCSSCFSPLPSCCSSLPLSSAELRAALHLLHSPLPTTSLPPPPRLFGLLTNRDKLMSSSDSDVASKIREGAREMARARGNLSDDVAWEEAALCLVMTNAVEVQDDKTGRILGIAVYDKDFSWINHSCSPNACYRFSLSEPNAPSFRDEKKKRIAPHVVFDSTEAETQGKSDVCISCELKEGSKRHGPRIIVRSIKPINKGEEVTVAYTDLLQPKGMRQSELWSKYQFVCHCRRCSASPPSYVDMALEETFSSNPEFSSLSSDYNFLKDEANQKLTDWMDEVTSEYLLVGDPESCCQKLENILTQGLQGELLESEKVKIQLNLRLHPLHHLSLNAYTTLASAYKIRSIDLLALNSDIDGQQLDAFDMSRTSAAYSFLLAGATDHLFRSESSLIAASANFWASAGESLLTLARSPGWKLFVKPESPMSTSSPENHECSNCSQVDRFLVNPFLSQSQNVDFQIICNEFLACITNMTRKVWGFLISGCGYLQMLKDPIDFSWLRQSSNLCHTPCCSDEESNKETEYQENICRRVMQRCDGKERITIFQLGVHCIAYGGYLANICYGPNSHWPCKIKNVVQNEEKSACDEKMDEFLKRCFYHSGQYDSQENFAALDKKLMAHEGGRVSNRLFYLSIPPNIFIDAVRCASSSASSGNGWTRVIVEKPFGRDSESSAAMTKSLKQYLKEDQIFRIDHYLGKELVENLSVLRFSNLIFEPLWSRQYIRNVQLIFSEDFGTEGRGGYFDHYGIIRDIMQNHLLQILALFAMETPVSLDAEDTRNEKVKVLRSMRPLRLEDVVTGQYKSHTKGGVSYPAYTDDKTVSKDSLTPTFAAAALFIDNARWDGVPFLMKAGKALHTRRTEIRVQFRHVPGNLYNRNFGTDLDRATNELVLRVQPDEAIYLKINNKVPGLGMRLDRSHLNLHYAARYSKEIPDAYERLLLDAIEGERRLFIRSDELDAAWALFTPLLKELEEKKIIPEYYPYGSRGPVGAHYLAARYNVRWGDLGVEQ